MLALQVLSTILAFVVPGVALAAAANPAWSWPLRLLVGVTLGTLVVPLASFSAAWLLRQSVTPPLVLATAALVTAPPALLAWWRRRKAPR